MPNGRQRFMTHRRAFMPLRIKSEQAKDQRKVRHPALTVIITFVR